MHKKKMRIKGIAAIRKNIDRELRHLAWLETNMVEAKIIKSSSLKIFKLHESRSICLQSGEDRC